MQKCAEPRADTGGCWEVCMCGFFCNTNDDDKMMIHPLLMGGVEEKNSVGHPTSVTAVVVQTFV